MLTLKTAMVGVTTSLMSILSLAAVVSPPSGVEENTAAAQYTTEPEEQEALDEGAFYLSPSEPTPTEATGQPAPAVQAIPSAPVEPSRPVVHHPEAVLDPADWPFITTAWEYVATYAGLCPSEQPKDDAFYPDWKYRAAIGLWTDGYTWQNNLESLWVNYKKGTSFSGYEHIIAMRDTALGGDNDLAYYVRWRDFTVHWDYVWEPNQGKYYIWEGNADKVAGWDQLASEMTTYLRYMDNLYSVRCPND